MATDFDDAMLQIGGVLSRMSNSEKSVQLHATLKAFNDSEFDAQDFTKLADSLSQLPKYAMSEEDQKALTEVFESIWTAIDNKCLAVSAHAAASCAALWQVKDRFTKKEQQSLAAHRIAAIKSAAMVVQLCEQIGKFPVGCGEEVAESLDVQAAPDAHALAKSRLVILSRHIDCLRLSKANLAKDKDDTTWIDLHITQGSEVASKFAEAFIEGIKKAAANDIEKVARLGRGCSLSDAAQASDASGWSCIKDETWPAFLATAEKHLLPTADSDLASAIQAAEAKQAEFAEVVGKHKIEQKWPEIDTAVRAAKITASALRLTKAYVGGGDAAALRKVTQQEGASLKKLKFAVTELPKGLQLQMAAAMKGSLIGRT